MPARHPVLRHRFGGGWGPDFGPTAEIRAEGNLLSIPWLVNADNIEFELDGGIRKVGGAQKLNSTVLESGAEVRGLFDYWRQGVGGSPIQKRVCHVGTVIKKDDADGTFTNIFTGLSDDAVPSYAVFDDYLILMSDSTDVPKYWDQSTAKDLGTNTPNGSFGVTHKNRFWMAGDASAPSTVYYSMTLPSGADGDWNDSTAGSINVDPGDGDRITGLATHKNELWVFKGPYRGSIHRITGSSPNDFARTTFVEGLGCIYHNTIFHYRDDLGFMAPDGTIHSLNATAAYGDFNEAALSLPLNRWLREHVTHDSLKFAWAKNFVSQGRVVFTIPTDTSATPNQMLYMDYRFMDSEGAPRWSKPKHVEAACVAAIVDTANNNVPAFFTGGNDGFIRRMDRANRSVDGSTGYTGKATTPFIHYGTPIQMKTLEAAAVGLSPRGNYNMTFGWQRDDEAQQTETVSQSGGDVLAPAPANQFTLGTSVLGGSSFADRFLNIEEGGEFRSIQYEVSQGGTDEDMEVHTISAAIHPDARSLEN